VDGWDPEAYEYALVFRAAEPETDREDQGEKAGGHEEDLGFRKDDRG